MARFGGEELVVLIRGDHELAAWPLVRATPVGIALADHLARLQLAARRLGCSIVVQRAQPDLVELLELLGLRSALLQDVGEPERREQSRVEEIVMPDDPVA